MVIQSNFFQYIYHVGCVFNFLSIISSGLIPGDQSLSNRQTVLFFLLVDPMDKSHQYLKVIDLNVPRHAQYLHNAWKKHQDAVIGTMLILQFGKQSSFKEYFQPIVFHKWWDWRLEKSYMRNMCFLVSSGLISGGESSIKKSILLAFGSYGLKSQGSQCDWLDCNASCTIHLHNSWKKHQDAVYPIDINLAF